MPFHYRSRLIGTYHIYEHILLDHWQYYLKIHENGIGCFAQTSQERQNAIQQQFVSTMCFSGSKKGSVPNGMVLNECVDAADLRLNEEHSLQERVLLIHSTLATSSLSLSHNQKGSSSISYEHMKL